MIISPFNKCPCLEVDLEEIHGWATAQYHVLQPSVKSQSCSSSPLPGNSWVRGPTVYIYKLQTTQLGFCQLQGPLLGKLAVNRIFCIEKDGKAFGHRNQWNGQPRNVSISQQRWKVLLSTAMPFSKPLTFTTIVARQQVPRFWDFMEDERSFPMQYRRRLTGRRPSFASNESNIGRQQWLNKAS